MELGLSLGDAAKPFDFLENKDGQSKSRMKTGGLDFCMRLGVGIEEREKVQENDEDDDEDDISEGDGSDNNNNEGETALELNLLPLAPAPLRISSNLQSLPWSSDNGSSENGSSGNMGLAAAKGLDVNKPAVEEASSANSVGSDLFIYRSNGHGSGGKRDFEATGNDVAEAERASSRASDDDENNNRKKLRLSKEQSAFLEESFKEHNTLNPKQKLALAKQLNLRPRQVEVWFQNRRARTKLKQTEVDCEYLKRCCETLTDENRRLHKEVQELRALKSSNLFYMQRPATTLTMCPSCERVASTATAPKGKGFPPNRPKFFPFPQTPTHPNQPAAS